MTTTPIGRPGPHARPPAPPAQGTAADEGPPAPSGHDWRAAGAAWGHAAADWACLYEHYSLDILMALFARLRVGPGCRLLDVACGAGLAVRLAAATGAEVAGIDASAELLAIAAARTPAADLRVGSMFGLPWPDATFDAVISVNGIWGGCDAALAEMARVVRPGGTIGFSFWGGGPPNDLRACFKAFARHAPPEHFTSMKRLNDIGSPGVAEAMAGGCGLEVVESGARTSVVEWPDADIAWRALASAGPAVPALAGGDPEALRADVLTAVASCRDSGGVYRFRNEHRFVVARRRAL